MDDKQILDEIIFVRYKVNGDTFGAFMSVRRLIKVIRYSALNDHQPIHLIKVKTDDGVLIYGNDD